MKPRLGSMCSPSRPEIGAIAIGVRRLARQSELGGGGGQRALFGGEPAQLVDSEEPGAGGGQLVVEA